jgi:HAD superfamily hydrolase (TIGR01509 family)
MTSPPSRPGGARNGAVRGVLLDVDGTLLLSNQAHAEAFAVAFREAGLDIPAERVRPLIGMGSDKLLPELTGLDEEGEEGKAIVERKKAAFRELLPAVSPAPGARALLERLRDRGLTLVVATSAGSDELDPLLERAGVRDLIDGRTSSSDVERSKPDPDIVAAAVERSGHPAGSLVMLGDTPYDVAAARRAGVRIVAVRCGGWGDADLAGAAAVYDDPAHLLRELDGSPLAAGSDDA